MFEIVHVFDRDSLAFGPSDPPELDRPAELDKAGNVKTPLHARLVSADGRVILLESVIKHPGNHWAGRAAGHGLAIGDFVKHEPA